MINESFQCEHCEAHVEKHPNGSARNHCPACLHSKHLDKNSPGDRLSTCYWIMPPVWIDFKKNKWNMIKHRCQKCGKEMLNKIAADDDFLNFQKNLRNI